MVPVSDQEAAIAWYRDELASSVVVDVPYAGPGAGSRSPPGGGGTTIALVRPMGAFQPGQATGIGLESKDVRALYDDVKAKGVDVDAEPMGGDGTVPLLFGFRDGDGNNPMVAEVE